MCLRFRSRLASRKLWSALALLGLLGIAFVLLILVRNDFGKLELALRFSPAVTVAISTAILIMIAIIGGYRFNWAWTGFGDYTYTKPNNQEFQRGKTLWDWMQLLVIPAVFLIATTFYNDQNSKTQLEISNDNQREVTLQKYVDDMSELLLNEDLLSPQNQQVRTVARLKTFNTLRRIDNSRKGILLQFLYDSQLISTTNPIINLDRADLTGLEIFPATFSGADLSGADLSGAILDYPDFANATLVSVDLSEAWLYGGNFDGAVLREAELLNTSFRTSSLNNVDLRNANLSGASLHATSLENADLRGANLRDVDLEVSTLQNANLLGSDLQGANLAFADLQGAQVTTEQLQEVHSLEGATLPDGSIHK